MGLPRKSRPRCACGRATCSAFIDGKPVCARCAKKALKKLEPKKEAERVEGWGSLDNARDAHYFMPDGRSLCGRWLAFGTPHWETNQELGSAATKGTCKRCWKKAAAKANSARDDGEAKR